MSRRFDIVCPFDTLERLDEGSFEKGDQYDDVYIGRMAGWASTPDLDSDGERVLQEGLDTSEYVSKGWVNWNHQGHEVIGVPRLAELRDRGNGLGKGLYTEFDLLKNDPMAKHVWNKSLAMKGTGRSFGLSLEGKKVAVSKKGAILKAKVLNVAVCPNPKNTNTSVEALVKAMVTEDIDALKLFEPVEFTEDSVVTDRVAGIVASSIQKAMESGSALSGTNQSGGAAMREEAMEKSPADLVPLPKAHTMREVNLKDDSDLSMIRDALVRKADERGGYMTKAEAALGVFLITDHPLVDCFKAFGLID